MGKTEKRAKRKKRIRAKLTGVDQKPRLSVFRSNSHIYAQVIDDEKRATLVSASDMELKANTNKGSLRAQKKTEGTEKDSGKSASQETLRLNEAYEVGKLVAGKAAKKKIKKVAFDRGGYRYHGRVAALAKGAREGGLEF